MAFLSNGRVTVDFKDIQPKFHRPELLTHPNIPRAVHGLNPRTVKEHEWWNKVRREAYAKNNGCCWACGQFGPMEAHECYNIYYYAAIIELKEVVALCRDCHNFIHSGRMRMLVRDGKMSLRQASTILITRLMILKENNLKPFYGTKAVYYNLVEGLPFYSALMEVKAEGLAVLANIPRTPRHLWILVVGEEVFTT